ncbi:MAG: UvrD-helicase domain-containing protein [Bacteroidales bacterium]|nr:UvrD-helicase domain-containing protein [Bacteroidales bacterium]
MTNNVNAILDGLNPEQLDAVQCVEGPVLIVAGAGSGKTRVLTSRIAYMLAQGVAPESVLALTFTKKAAAEMKERIALMVGEQKARKLYMGTFHSVFIRFLREFASEIGFPSSFTIYDTSDSVSAIKACIKELGLDEKVYKPKTVLSRISKAKNNLITFVGYRNNQPAIMADVASKMPKICDLYQLYATKCKQSGVMDFDDILLYMNILLRDSPAALKSISERFSHILVDEYQDTNFAQYLILKKLCQAHGNICVVGDDSQSIYSFRGARIENILNFRKDFPKNKVFRLERNYRSTQTIVNAANSVIAKNTDRIPKECHSMGDEGEKIELIRSYTEQEEAVQICSEILGRMRKAQCEYRDFAILYRTNSQSRALEEALRRRNIPYQIFSGNSFYDRAEVKDMMAYFKLVCNVGDEESFKRVVNKPARGIGETSMSALDAAAKAHKTTLFKAAYLDDLAEFGLKDAAAQKIRNFCDMINGFAMNVHKTDAHEIAARIADDSGLYNLYKLSQTVEDQARAANIEELLNSVQSFIEDREEEVAQEEDVPETMLVTLSDFLDNAALLSAVDVEDEGEDANNKVTLMTVHSSKGLEFRFVFIAGLEENLFPSGGWNATPQDIEEERRLFYVAVTRAKEAVSLSFAKTRMRNGKHESNAPSRFVKEIDRRYILNPLMDDDFDDSDTRDEIGFPVRRRSFAPQSEITFRKRSAPAPLVPPRPKNLVPLNRAVPKSDPGFISDPIEKFKVGMRIEHNKFGKGTIFSMEGKLPDTKAVIDFDGLGRKVLILKFAKIKIL